MTQLRAALAALAAVALLAIVAPAAFGASAYKPDQFALTHFSTEASDTLAGGHPDVRADFGLAHVGVPPGWESFGRARRIEVDMPYGLVGDPTAYPTCSRAQFHAVTCPPQSQVGVAEISVGHFPPFGPKSLYNIEPGPGAPAQFGIMIAAGQIFSIIDVEVRPDGGLTAIIDDTNATSPLIRSDVTLWGVPYDSNLCNPNHPDFDPTAPSPYLDGAAPCPTTNPADWERKPFTAAPTDCGRRPETRLRVFSYEGYSDSGVSYDPLPTDCESLAFEPAVSVRPTNTRVDGVSGLDVELTVPQSEDPDGRATAHLRDATVVLPEGVSVNPGLARGLEACSDAQFGKGVEGPATCPAASKVGTLRVDTPLLDDPLPGEIYVGQPLPGNRYRLFLNVEGRGVIVKLVGTVRPDPATGQLTTTFVDNPPMPFSKMTLSFQGGERGVLAMAPTCGAKTTSAWLTPFSTGTAVFAGSSFDVSWDGAGAPCPATMPFAPALAGGSAVATAGAYSPFGVSFVKPDAHQTLSGVNVELPEGFLAKVKGVPLCPADRAAAGNCPLESRVGKVTVGSGPGASPFFVDGSVSLTGPYENPGQELPGVEGASDPVPYGLAVAVRAIAGPYDLGKVVVRQSVHVDPKTAAVTVISDPLPTILEGVPLRVQRIDVEVDRPGFALNPTSCTPKRIGATFRSTGAALSERSVHYQAAGCKKLRFKPRLSLALTGRKQVRTGGHPGVRAVVKQRRGDAGIAKAVVTLPKSLALDPDNAQALCEFADGTKPDLESHCPKGSIVGRATARTPLLNRPLAGKVYFVKNVRRNPKTGNAIRTLPMIVVALRGEIAINLRGESNSAKDGRLVNTFASVPDAPISQFDLRIDGGRTGILAVTRTRKSRIDLCARPKSHIAETEIDGQNGKDHDRDVTVKTPCKAKASSRTTRKEQR